ncbi:MAG: hypothetical protein K9M94_07875 [Spirochaetia bacterium]|nr:hypothetical protein [Spirochaetia bacterium]
MDETYEPQDNEALQRRFISFFREEVERRYRLDYLETVPAIEEEGLLEGLDHHTIDQVKAFFQEVLYPAGEQRKRRDESVEAVVDILNNRVRLLTLLPKMPGFLVKHGGSLVTAARAGLEVLATFRHSIKVERLATENIQELREAEGLTDKPAEEIPEALLRRAFISVPRRDIEHMIGHLKTLTELGMRRGTVDATLEVLRAIRDQIASEKEAVALRYAVEVMEQLKALVQDRSRQTLKRFVRIAENTERHYIAELEQSV